LQVKTLPLDRPLKSPTRSRKGSKTSRGAIHAKAQDSRPPLQTYLKGIIASLNSTDRAIAVYVVANPEETISAPITDIKEQSGASVGAIVKFCRRLGYKGFAAFKIALARDLAQSVMSANEASASKSLFETVFQFHRNSLAETIQINSEAVFDRVTQVLENARRIEIFSIGLSYPVAYTAYCKFALLGLPASAQSDSHIQLINATQLKGGEVAFGISCSGNTRETVQCLEAAKSGGATTICLTNAMESPITAVSDLSLYATPSEIKYFQAPLASRITQLAIVDALFVSIALKNKNKTAAKLQHSGEELLKRRWK
jgi:RpiR family transcriptional regulator, carbohydrate utilization regulator